MSLIKDSKDVFSKLPCLNPPTPSRGKQAVGGAPSLDTGMISLQIAMAWWECVCMGWEIGLGDRVGQNPTNSVHLRNIRQTSVGPNGKVTEKVIMMRRSIIHKHTLSVLQQSN